MTPEEKLDLIHERVKAINEELCSLREKNLALKESLKWALSEITMAPYEWGCDEDSDAHEKAIALLKE